MNRVKMLISSLLLTMILSCGACGKKAPPVLQPKGFSSSYVKTMADNVLPY